MSSELPTPVSDDARRFIVIKYGCPWNHKVIVGVEALIAEVTDKPKKSRNSRNRDNATILMVERLAGGLSEQSKNELLPVIQKLLTTATGVDNVEEFLKIEAVYRWATTDAHGPVLLITSRSRSMVLVKSLEDVPSMSLLAIDKTTPEMILADRPEVPKPGRTKKKKGREDDEDDDFGLGDDDDDDVDFNDEESEDEDEQD